MAIKQNGTLWAWGGNESGQLGDGTTENRWTPVQVGTDMDWAAVVASSGAHTLALKNDGSLWAFGENGIGQLGDGTYQDRLVPTRIGTETDWSRIAAGYEASLALKSDGSLWAWGENASGLYGNGTKQSRSVPVRISDGWQSVALGWHSVLGIRSDGSLWAWGENSAGQLGQSDILFRSSPFAVP